MENNNYFAPMADGEINKVQGGEYTGKFLVLLDEDRVEEGLRQLRSHAGVAAAEYVSSQDAPSAADVIQSASTVVLEDLAVAVVDVEPDQRSELRTAADLSAVRAVEPERVLSIYQTTDYLQGYRDGVSDTIKRTMEHADTAPRAVPSPPAVSASWNEFQATWGLQAIRATETSLMGRGVGVAVLDTGADRRHPDLAPRLVENGRTASFIPKETVDDAQGHGTHCAGTACGPKQPMELPRYGVACEADLFVGKVLANSGFGADSSILAGLAWAISQPQVKVVSMSLGLQVGFAPPSVVYEQVARQALQKGTLIVAAAGNESRRPALVMPVAHPANCPSILAVGAVGRDFTVPHFSNGGRSANGGEVNLAAPGVDVLSARPGGGYRRLNGTSMATPHVAGVAAMLWQQKPNASAAEIADALLRNAQALLQPVSDVGVGLVQAPLG